MSQTYYNLLTIDGAAAFTNATVNGEMVALSHIAVGDGNGAAIQPDESMTALVHEVYRAPIRKISRDANNPHLVSVEAVVPVDVGGWTMREIGVIGDGKLLTIGNYAPSDKTQLVEGMSKEILIRIFISVGNANLVNLTVDPSVATVSHAALAEILELYLTVDDAATRYLTAEAADERYLREVSDATTTKAGVVELATLTETRAGTDTSRAVTPAGLKGLLTDHGNDPDPHTQYMTQAKTEALLNPAISNSMAIMAFEQGAY
ncbi:phage tail protein [Pseudomonas sp. 21LCFQ010]|uniref:phage tail protein n=1 Tax=Pseudomonas sp. 21LCFQ010 TaxID=2957506 RepID=UPI002097661C|nr:phage tail protein [Pseudomonas sp. 21LCFQ010]MCO8161988.1 phage tail protein [Pseudomonas sp. 21LCFQ010]